MLIPGVSGGTVALMCGIYYKLIISVDTFFEKPNENMKFLMSVALGGILGVLLFSRLILAAYNTFMVPMIYMFIGAVLGSIPLLIKSSGIKKLEPSILIYPIIGIACVFLIEQIPKGILSVETEGFVGYIALFIAGVFLSTPLVLPGISFSYMLLILGIFEPTLIAINTINLKYLIPLCLGILIGTFITAKIIRLILKKYHVQTYMVIIGFVISSLKDIYPGFPQGNDMFISLILMIVSFALVYKFSEK